MIPKDEVAGDDDPDGPAGPHADRRLNAEIALDDALSGIVHRVARSIAKSAHEIVVVTGAKLGADSENGRKTRRREDAIPMMIRAIAEARIALRIGARRRPT